MGNREVPPRSQPAARRGTLPQRQGQTLAVWGVAQRDPAGAGKGATAPPGRFRGGRDVEGAPATTSTVRERRRSLWQSLLATYRYELGAAALWLALAGVLAGLTSRVQDWYVMTDELLYERLAISIAHLGSPLPHVHGELIGNVNQLYPLLLAPLFHGTLVPPGLHHAHVLNAFVMSSAAVPAYLLTRRVTQSVRLSYVVAALTICIPWIAISSFLMTEVVAYPVFVWAALALHHALVAPRPRHDALLLFALGVAILARTQFAVFLLAVPFALLIHEFAFAPQSSLRPRLAATARGVVSVHRVLAVAYACLLLAALGLLAAGRLSSALGTYSVTAEGNLFPSGMAHSLVEHLAPIGLGMGILPFVVGIAWLGTAVVRSRTREQHAFAALAVVVILALLLEVTSYDLRFGQGRLHDRYLFYVVPLVLVAFAAALRDRSWSRWPVFASAGLLALALAYLPVVRYDKFNVDSPVAFLNGPLLNVGGSVNGARLFLAFVTIAAGGLLLLASVLLGRRRTAVILLAIAALAMPVEAGLAFNRLFTRARGRSEGHDAPLPLPLRHVLGKHRLLVERRVLERVDSASGSVRRRLHRHARHVPDHCAELRLEDRPLQRVAERLRRPGRRRDEVRTCGPSARQRPWSRARAHREAVARRMARSGSLPRRLDRAQDGREDPRVRHAGPDEPDDAVSDHFGSWSSR